MVFRSSDPTVWDDVDGIVIDESAPPANVAGVAANTAILVGETQRGPTEMTLVSSIGEFFEKYGKNDSYGVNSALKNKKFGLLKVIRALASDSVLATRAFSSSATPRITFSAKQGKGVYGNSIQVKIEEASSARQEQWSIDAVADSSDSLDGKYFILPDNAGTVAFWIDTDDSGTSAPSHGADRAVEITTIETDDSASTVASKVAAAINADSKFSAEVDEDDDTLVIVTASVYDELDDDFNEGDAGFDITLLQEGVYAGKKYTIHDNNLGAVLPDEVYDDVGIASITSDTFAASQLIIAVVNSSAADPDNSAFVGLQSGSDGAIADTDYETAIALAEVENAGNFIFLDSYNSTRNGYLKQHVANTQDKMTVVSGPEAQTVSEAVTDVANYRDADGRIIYAFPWVQTSIGGVLTYTNPASWLVSIMSQTSPHIDPAFAGNVQFSSGMTALKLALNRNNYISLKNAGICAFERDEDLGFKVKSGIVTQIANSSKVTITRRRMADFLTVSVAAFLKNYQNAVNGKSERTEVKGAILNFIRGLEDSRILPKDSDVNTGKAKLVDTEVLNTDTTIGLGFFKILWKQRIFSSMRFIVLQAEIGETVVVTDQE